MADALSPNTKAILLLTAPLIAAGGKKSKDLLTPSEYRKLARHLRDVGSEPADLLTPDAGQLLEDCARVVPKERLRRLLGRGFLLSQALEHWQARSIWVASRADSAYPRRLKIRLKAASAPLLYGCGECGALDGGGLADAALVVSAEVGKGGTWAGATEQLEKLRLVPVYVRSTGRPSKGLKALQDKGALPWPNPESADKLDTALAAPAPVPDSEPAQSVLSFDLPAESTAGTSGQ